MSYLSKVLFNLLKFTHLAHLFHKGLSWMTKNTCWISLRSMVATDSVPFHLYHLCSGVYLKRASRQKMGKAGGIMSPSNKNWANGECWSPTIDFFLPIDTKSQNGRFRFFFNVKSVSDVQFCSTLKLLVLNETNAV